MTGQGGMGGPATISKLACHRQSGMSLEAMLESKPNEPNQDGGCLA
jgi:hypothetical protein